MAHHIPGMIEYLAGMKQRVLRPLERRHCLMHQHAQAIDGKTLRKCRLLGFLKIAHCITPIRPAGRKRG